MREPVKIWRFCDAPKEFQELSDHGGDEDYILWLPPDWDEWGDDYRLFHFSLEDLETEYDPKWLHCQVRTLADGAKLVITAHA